MNKHEFESRLGSSVPDDDYQIIETVYTFHPGISNTEGKDQIAKLYKTMGMAFIRSMYPYARALIEAHDDYNQACRDQEKAKSEIDFDMQLEQERHDKECEKIREHHARALADTAYAVKVAWDREARLEGIREG